MKNKLLVLVILMTISSLIYGSSMLVHSEKENYVPDAQTAIRIAEAIWLPIYGEEILLKKPYTARLVNNKIWVVEGWLDPESVGGVQYIKIQKSDCKILEVYHTK